MAVQLEFASSYAGCSFTNDTSLCHGQMDTPYGSLCMVCTGMSGPPENVMAGCITFEIIRRVFTSVRGRAASELIESAVREANDVLYSMVESNRYPHGMGADLVALLIEPEKLHESLVCHVGCNRAYRIRKGTVSRLTHDHFRLGGILERAPSGTDSEWHIEQTGIVTRSIGTDREVEPEIMEIDVDHGDRYVLCDRCVSDRMTDSDFLELYHNDPREYASRILEFAGTGNGGRNPVVQVVDVSSL
ncbi:MAG: hypothetical protein R6U39_05790 [Candidatus Aegiribacteria sp.]